MRESLWNIHLKIGFQPFYPRFSVFKMFFVAFNVQAASFVSHYGQFSTWRAGEGWLSRSSHPRFIGVARQCIIQASQS